MTDEDLERTYDRIAGNTVIGLGFILDEIRRRDAARAAAASRELAEAALRVSRSSRIVALVSLAVAVLLGVTQLVLAIGSA